MNDFDQETKNRMHAKVLERIKETGESYPVAWNAVKAQQEKEIAQAEIVPEEIEISYTDSAWRAGI